MAQVDAPTQQPILLHEDLQDSIYNMFDPVDFVNDSVSHPETKTIYPSQGTDLTNSNAEGTNYDFKFIAGSLVPLDSVHFIIDVKGINTKDGKGLTAYTTGTEETYKAIKNGIKSLFKQETLIINSETTTTVENPGLLQCLQNLEKPKEWIDSEGPLEGFFLDKAVAGAYSQASGNTGFAARSTLFTKATATVAQTIQYIIKPSIDLFNQKRVIYIGPDFHYQLVRDSDLNIIEQHADSLAAEGAGEKGGVVITSIRMIYKSLKPSDRINTQILKGLQENKPISIAFKTFRINRQFTISSNDTIKDFSFNITGNPKRILMGFIPAYSSSHNSGRYFTQNALTNLQIEVGGVKFPSDGYLIKSYSVNNDYIRPWWDYKESGDGTLGITPDEYKTLYSIFGFDTSISISGLPEADRGSPQVNIRLNHSAATVAGTMIIVCEFDSLLTLSGTMQKVHKILNL